MQRRKSYSELCEYKHLCIVSAYMVGICYHYMSSVTNVD